jgi:FMN phosphatase YigB (HAD superfamily)
MSSVFRSRLAINLWRQPMHGSVEGLKALARARLRVGVVSNSDGTVTKRLLRSGVCQVGEGPGVPVLAIVDSAVVGVAKPDPACFKHGIEAMGLPPSQIAYVGTAFPTMSAERRTPASFPFISTPTTCVEEKTAPTP